MKAIRPRAICLGLLNRVEGADRHPDQLLTDAFKRYRHLTPLDRSFITELTYGVFRWREKLDWIVRSFSRIPFDKIEPEILNVLRLGLYQILFLSRTPVSAAVNESVELSKKFRGRGGGGFVNGILRSIIREREHLVYPDPVEDPVLHVSVVQSHPLWLVRRWIAEMGIEETLRVCQENNQMAPMTLRTNTLRTGRTALVEKLRGEGLDPSPTRYSDVGIHLLNPPPTSGLPYRKNGLYILQDEASQLITTILAPQPNETILDACAAPGGKTTHIAQRMGNTGNVYALDLTREKLSRIEKICACLGVKGVKFVRGDASVPLPIPKGLIFDRILADVPCSGFGTLRRNPDTKWRKGEEDVRRLHEVQSSIIQNLSSYLRTGGVLVYSTCTIFHEENEDVVETFLEGHPEFQLREVQDGLPESCHPFVREGVLKTFPHGNGMDGFFAARFIKTR